MLLLSIDIIVGGSAQYTLNYEYLGRGVIAYVCAVDSTDRELVDFDVYSEFKPTLTPRAGNMVLVLPGLSGSILLVKTTNKRLLKFIQSGNHTVPFDRLQITVAGTAFDGVVHYIAEGASVPKAGHSMKFDDKSTDMVNGLISTKISEKSQELIAGLMSVF